jgi:hypothetical protein
MIEKKHIYDHTLRICDKIISNKNANRVPHDAVPRLCPGVVYFRNVTQFYDAKFDENARNGLV